jgi:uncharacterized protein YbaP (TraB family)
MNPLQSITYVSITAVFLLYAATVGYSQSLFWEISGNGLQKPSYLYGTMHVQDNAVFQFKPTVLPALDSADFLLLELNLDSVNPIELMASLVMSNDQSLDKLLKKKEYTIVEKFFKDSLNMSIYLFNRVQPFYTATIVSSKDLKKEQDDALDAYFFKRAKSNHIPCFGLEKITEQIGAFSAIPYPYQANYLVQTIKNINQGQVSNETDDLMNLYLQGDIDGLVLLTLQAFDDPLIHDVFKKHFIVQRNENMVTRMLPYLEHGSAFIAVGAAHLGSEDGIIHKLKLLGYTVRPL